MLKRSLYENKNQGIRTYQTLMKEYNQEKAHVETLEKKISDIKQNIDSWQTNSIERERIARQDLGMSFTNELVYIIPQK